MTLPRGLYGFPITPADDSGRVDVVAVRRLSARLVDAQVAGIGLLGSTGTYMYLNREERCRAADAAIAEVNGRLPVIVGIGALRTDDAVAFAVDARAAGAAAGLLAPVSYTPLSEDEVFTHVATVADKSGLPLIVYDNPWTTHFRFTPDLVARLAGVSGIVGIKNPAGNREEVRAHLVQQRQSVSTEFSVGYSADANTTEAMIAGADIWYSVSGGILPRAGLDILAAIRQGDADAARRLNADLTPLWGLFTRYSSLRVVYAIADLLGICRAVPPRPILSLETDAVAQVRQVLFSLPADWRA